jgi:transcriptional regulator with XRE-family HTH domain
MLREFAAEFRAARRAAGLSQQAVAAACGISRSSIERLELDQSRGLSLLRAAELAAVVGLDLSVRTYRGPRAVRDSGQLRLFGRLRTRVGDPWGWDFEVQLDIPGDQRAWDARISHRATGSACVVEAVTRLVDVQSILRDIARKRRDGGNPRVILLLADTRANAAALSEAADVITSVFPIGTRAALRAFSEGRIPEADAVIVL